MMATKLDVYGSGRVRLNELTEALIRSKAGIHGLDISATRNGFRRLCNKGRALDYQVEDVGRALKMVLRKLTESEHSTGERVRQRDQLVTRRNELLSRLGITDPALTKNPAALMRTLRIMQLQESAGGPDASPASTPAESGEEDENGEPPRGEHTHKTKAQFNRRAGSVEFVKKAEKPNEENQRGW